MARARNLILRSQIWITWFSRTSVGVCAVARACALLRRYVMKYEALEETLRLVTKVLNDPRVATWPTGPIGACEKRTDGDCKIGEA